MLWYSYRGGAIIPATQGSTCYLCTYLYTCINILSSGDWCTVFHLQVVHFFKLYYFVSTCTYGTYMMAISCGVPRHTTFT